jgi:hypothetical protein
VGAEVSNIRTQRFVVEVSASVMPPMTERELHDAVAHFAFAKERGHGMGTLGVSVTEVFDADVAAPFGPRV